MYGLTEKEKAIWPPKKKMDGFSVAEKAFWFALFIILISAVIHNTIEPKSHNTPVSYQSDAQLCAAVATGTPVHGATASQIVSYCLSHG